MAGRGDGMDGGMIMSTKFAAGPVKVPGSNRIPSGSNRQGEFFRAEVSRSDLVAAGGQGVS